MQSFKQFLEEGIKHNFDYPQAAINWRGIGHKEFPDNLDRDKVKVAIEKALNIQISDLEIDEFVNDNHIVRVLITKSTTREQLKQLRLQLYDFLETYFDIKLDRDHQRDSMIIVHGQFPNFKISCDNAILNYDKTDDVSLCKIHKYLECNEIKIFNSERIKEGGLSLLQIRGIENITNPSHEGTEWFPIIRKAIIDHQDIMDVREELIKKGLKEFAKS